MSLKDKQVLITTIAVPALCVLGFSYLAWADYQKIHLNEMSDENPAAAEVTDDTQWGEVRRTQEFQKQIDQLRGEADLITSREQDVIAYREIIQRDATILPDRDLVNSLAQTIDEFARKSGVDLTRVSDLNPGNGEGAIRRMPIRLTVSGGYDQLLRFLNLFESMDRIVNVRGFTITAGTAPATRDAAASHSIALELETYIYNNSAGLAKPVEIAGYDRRKEDPVVRKLINQQRAARIEKYQLKPRINRRDPLVDPRRAESADAHTFTEVEEQAQRAILDKLRVDVELLNEDVRQLLGYNEQKKYLLVAQLRALIQEKLGGLDLAIREADKKIVIPSLRDSFQDEVVAQYAKIKDQSPQTIGDLVMDRKQVGQFYEPLKLAHEAGDFEAVVRRMHEFEEWARERQIIDEAMDLVTAMRDIARQDQVMLDFEKVQITVQGMIRRPEGTIVILNGKARKSGDYIDEAQRIRLVGVKDSSLVFEFEGFEITRATGKKQ